MNGDASMTPWIERQIHQLSRQHSHAWLLHGPSGLGQYSLGLSLARVWLCEQASDEGACGKCRSCHAIDVHTHADLCVLMPEVEMLELGWPLSEKAQSELNEKKRKPSKEIRVDAMRDAIEFCQRTSARGCGKVVLIFPAESMNAITANTLLKTLEEPPGAVKFILISESVNRVLPTIRSRCIGHAMEWPTVTESTEWLESLGFSASQAKILLNVSGGRPQDALKLSVEKEMLEMWSSFPAAVARNDMSFTSTWTTSQLVQALNKLCYDLYAYKVGASPRFFDVADLMPATTISIETLVQWSHSLVSDMRSIEHPWNLGLMQEVLLERVKMTLQSTA